MNENFLQSFGNTVTKLQHLMRWKKILEINDVDTQCNTFDNQMSVFAIPSQKNTQILLWIHLHIVYRSVLYEGREPKINQNGNTVGRVWVTCIHPSNYAPHNSSECTQCCCQCGLCLVIAYFLKKHFCLFLVFCNARLKWTACSCWILILAQEKCCRKSFEVVNSSQKWHMKKTPVYKWFSHKKRGEMLFDVKPFPLNVKNLHTIVYEDRQQTIEIIAESSGLGRWQTLFFP